MAQSEEDENRTSFAVQKLYGLCPLRYALHELASECRKQIKGFRKYLRDYDSGEV
jgi:hypothetical protein